MSRIRPSGSFQIEINSETKKSSQFPSFGDRNGFIENPVAIKDNTKKRNSKILVPEQDSVCNPSSQEDNKRMCLRRHGAGFYHGP